MSILRPEEHQELGLRKEPGHFLQIVMARQSRPLTLAQKAKGTIGHRAIFRARYAPAFWQVGRPSRHLVPWGGQ